MQYTIISCSPQMQDRSTSACIAKWIAEELGEGSKVYYINDKRNWQECAKAFYKSSNTIFVCTLYVEGIPGLMLEFLETLERNKKSLGTMSFVLQGGFEEASQLRTAEKFLEQLPAYFTCEYGGTLLKGGMFGMATVRGNKFKSKMEQSYKDAIKIYKSAGMFDKTLVKEFAGAEYYSKSMIRLAGITKPLNRMVWTMMARKMGIKGSITDKPYNLTDSNITGG